MDLIDAVINGDVELVRKLVTTENVNFQDKNMSTPLMFAAELENPEKSLQIVQILLDSGADVNLNNTLINDALIFATKTNNTDVIKLLIKAGANINNINNRGDNSLIWSSSYGNAEIVELLLKLGANPNIQNDKKATALHFVTSNKNITKLLLDAGANPNLQDSDGDTPLTDAVSKNNIEIVKLLLNAGANPDIQNNDGNTALLISTWIDNLNIGKLLLDSGANPDIRNNNNDTALILSTWKNNTEYVKLLLESGANPNIQTRTGRSPLMLACQYFNPEKSIEIIQLLARFGGNLFIKDNKDFTSLDICSNSDCRKIISHLMWKQLYNRDINTAQRYFNLGAKLNKDVLLMILLNKRQQQLCQNLSSKENKLILYEFALEFGMPVKEDMTKAQLCGMISRYLVYGKHSTNKPIEEENKFINEIKVAARARGINPELPVPEILRLLSTMF